MMCILYAHKTLRDLLILVRTAYLNKDAEEGPKFSVGCVSMLGSVDLKEPYSASIGQTAPESGTIGL